MKKIDEEKYAQFVNDQARISLYGDFLYPLAEDSTLEQYYKEQPEGKFCEELTECRTQIWNALHKFGMKLVCLSPAEFIHFGTTRELLELLTSEITDYEYLDWKPMVFTNYQLKKKLCAAVHNSLIENTVQVSERCYVENSWLRGNTTLAEGAVVSQLCLKDVEVPSMVMHGVVLKENKADVSKKYVVRAYGVKDNPKKTWEEKGSFLAGDLQKFANLNEVLPEEIWEGEEHSLWKSQTLSCS